MTIIAKTPTAYEAKTPANHNTSPIAQSFDRIADGFRADPASAKQRFTVYSEQTDGLKSEVEVRDFLFTVDEPAALGGSDAGPNPIELVLTSEEPILPGQLKISVERSVDVPVMTCGFHQKTMKNGMENSKER